MASTSNKKFYFALIAITTGVVIAIFMLVNYGDESINSDEDGVSAVKKPKVKMLQDQVYNEKTNKKNIKKAVIESTAVDFTQEKNQVIFNGWCGFSSADFYHKKKRTAVSDMSAKQLNAYEELESLCNDWYSYLNLNHDDVSRIENDIKEFREKFATYDVYQSDPEITSKTILELKKGFNKNSNFRLAEAQLYYLLRFDTELQLKMANELNTVSIDFVRSPEGAIYTTQLLLCNYSNMCSPNSLFMLDRCLSYDSACGLSMQQYLQTKVTYGQYSDWQNAADVLYRLIETGWFLEREVIKPEVIKPEDLNKH